MSQSTLFCVLLFILTFEVNHASGIIRQMANASLCPSMISYPTLVELDFGKKAVFSVNVEAKQESPIDAIWQRIENNGRTEDIERFVTKYDETEHLPSPKLVINNLDFDDTGYYQLQVQISDGWCTSPSVYLRKIRGILQYNSRCSESRECDERKNLVCLLSNSQRKCLCHNDFYHRNQTCFGKSGLLATNIHSNITSSEINLEWRDPSTDSDLIQHYDISITDNGGTIIKSASVGKQTSYRYSSYYVPGHRYYFKITSNVKVTDPSETFTVETQEPLIVEPLPPGPLIRNASNFHPEKLHIKWTSPGNNTRVDYYYINIGGITDTSYSKQLSLSQRLEPGKNYTVSIFSRSYEKSSKAYKEEISTLRTPWVIITPRHSVAVPYLSTMEITATVKNMTDFPPTLETKWETNFSGFNITYSRYNGSSLDIFNPKLVINRVDFDHEHGYWFRCSARNSEGWGTSEYKTTVNVHGSLKFSEPCYKTRECLENRYLTCRNAKCLCYTTTYHKDKICKSRNYLQAQSIQVQSSTCDITITWEHPTRDRELITGYQVVFSETVSVGNITEYTTPCELQPGKLYSIYVRSNIHLSNPTEGINIDSGTYYTILEPVKPGQLVQNLCNRSADNLYLRWEKSGENSFVNRYRVSIGDRSQETTGYEPEIYWGALLLPNTQYNVTITAISYGYSTNYASYGSKESLPTYDWILTEDSQYTGKAYLPYGAEDEVFMGDDETRGPLRSPTTVYVGDGSDGGFHTVYIGTNGIIGLGENFNSLSVYEMDSSKIKEKRIICPFWTDLKSDGVGKVYYKAYKRGSKVNSVDSLFMEKADDIVIGNFRDLKDFKATWLVKVTWENMTLYGYKERKVTFQCFLITDGENTFTVFNYIDVNVKAQRNRDISIGYRYGHFHVKNSLTNHKRAFQMSIMPGNTINRRGFWIYKMTDGVKSQKDEKECYLWYSHNVVNRIYEKLLATQDELECPCDPRLLRFDPRFTINRFDEKNRMLCYASMTLGMNVECCFNMYADTEHLGPLDRSMPFGGTVLLFNPFFERYKYNNFDLKPRNQCCKTGHCDLYYEVRPIPRCYLRSPFQPGINFGDPHITTLDGKDYTFNGYGEYTMIKINTSTTTFDLQARTELATAENGTSINATIFSAFAARDQTGSKVQIEMSRNKKEMIIRANGVDLTTKFRNASYVYRTPNISLQWENKTISAVFLKPHMILKISLGKRFLICETLVNEKYKGLTIGLMGNFDGNKTNDFILPNGTLLGENATSTERLIYYNFGQVWSVNEQSIFQYEDGFTFKNFTHSEFVPLFTDEVDESRLNEAKQKCEPNPSQACISDYLATGDIELAENSGNKEKDSKTDVEVIENETPQISGNVTINVEVNKEVELIFNASDDGKVKPTYKLLKQPDDFVFDNVTGIARWKPSNSNVSEISIVAIDGMGAQSPSLDISIISCSGCGDHGACNYENVIPTENDRFRRAVCGCDIGYSGESCERDIDACLDSPCPLERNCTDLTPEEEVRLGRGYNCTECPPGYKDIENKCQDVDECARPDLNTCIERKETCENTDGGYICNCKKGYRKLDRKCNDINECLEGHSECKHLCTNTPGSYLCMCHPGFNLNKDNITCHKKDNEDCSSEMQCEYDCSEINGRTQCFCPSGYKLTTNGKNCTDIDECALKSSPCVQDCINTNGSFQCACRPGFSLMADKTSCLRCEQPYYGVNCSHECQCGKGGDRCDPGLGCACKKGWIGKNCTVDIDECHQDPTICGINKVCINKEGSFNCRCEDGLQAFGDLCTDIDECLDATLNDCPQDTTECSNTFGNFTCECKEGFQKKNNVCEDIDECSTSLHGCSHKCDNLFGGYSCACYYGFALSEDRKTCEIERDSCSSFPELNCTYGCKRDVIDKSKGFCFCESGYELDKDKRSCKDIDECIDESTCDHNCTNKEGSYNCSCAIGYRLENDGRSCKACDQYHYGMNCEELCRCGRGARVCDNIQGCVCKTGWIGDTCDVDINECDKNPCTGPHERCVNAPGSYRCDCIEGFKNYSGVCEDIDECEEPFLCHQECDNTLGSYKCSCKSGYELISEKNCKDINECESVHCDHCSNFPGGFECSCNEGFRLNATTQKDCFNIDECFEHIDNCSENAICMDTEGSFNCSCSRGFKGNGLICTACHNFTFGEQCSDQCTCVPDKTKECDTVNGTCRCNIGWTGTDCSEDIDECKEERQICSTASYQICVNTPGSSHCECEFGGQNLSDCIQPKAPQSPGKTEVKVKAEFKFDVNISREDFLKNSQTWLTEIQTSLDKFYQEKIRGFIKVVVLSIRYGSADVDHELFGTKNMEISLKHDLANTMSGLARGKLKVNILNQTSSTPEIKIKDENGTVKEVLTTGTVSPCASFKSLDVCTSGQKCEESSGAASCVKEKSDLSDFSTYIVVLGVGIPLLITIVVLVIICLRYQKRTDKKEIKESSKSIDFREKNSCLKSTTDYDSITSKNMHQRTNEGSGYSGNDFDDSLGMVTGNGNISEGCSNQNYTLDSISEKLHSEEQFHIQRPKIKYNVTREQQY